MVEHRRWCGNDNYSFEKEKIYAKEHNKRRATKKKKEDDENCAHVDMYNMQWALNVNRNNGTIRIISFIAQTKKVKSSERAKRKTQINQKTTIVDVKRFFFFIVLLYVYAIMVNTVCVGRS